MLQNVQADFNETNVNSDAYVKNKPDYNDYLCFAYNGSGSNIRLDKIGSPYEISLEYSFDKSTWTAYTWTDSTGATISLTEGQKVYFRGNNEHFSKSASDYYKLIPSSNLKVSGNLMSLLDKNCESLYVPEYGFYKLFEYNAADLQADFKMPATSVGPYGYAYMFNYGQHLDLFKELPLRLVHNHGCENMFSWSQLANLPTGITFENWNGAYAFKNMFYHTQIKDASTYTLDYMGEGMYEGMFRDCTSLKYPPKLSNRTTASTRCYYELFAGCTSLTQAPDLPATTLNTECYYGMFKKTKITTAPELPATTLAQGCYRSMFENCTSLQVVPSLPATATTTISYYQMFKGCTNLKFISTSQTDFSGCYEWLKDASATGVFDCPSVLDTSTAGVSTVPSGWTVTHGASQLDDTTTSVVDNASTDSYMLCPGSTEIGVLAVGSAMTLDAMPISASSIAYAEVVLDIETGATVTAGTGITFVDSLTENKRNICVCRWSDGVCKLYVTLTEDLSTSSSAGN